MGNNDFCLKYQTFRWFKHGKQTIYTITGKLVGRNLTVKQMKQLPRGLYIVNGKRILVK